MRTSEFILELREHLKCKYRTRHQYTYGEDKRRAVRRGPAYILEQDNAREISGFCLWKDMCAHPPDMPGLVKDVLGFARARKIPIARKDDSMLEARIGNEDHLLICYVDKGYAGSIDVYCTKNPNV